MSEFVTWPDAALTRAAMARPVDAALLAAGARLQAAAADVQAYGLAAAHLGLVEPVVVVSVSDAKAARDYRLLFNPVIESLAETGSAGAEGSVSLPGIEVPITRADWCVLSYDDADGVRQTLRLEGFAARVAQHEIEQMNGVFFLSRLSRLKRETALRKFGKSQR
ncbi:peptide deformylase [Devosia sp. FKR38]|uniref:peptide deformylase n=1 Tax=Devosia sp. FKR38 TaxID=2562312 RepID=UPI0010BFF121|nr:peptide deformylase [Devosia sp. FKR38]